MDDEISPRWHPLDGELSGGVARPGPLAMDDEQVQLLGRIAVQEHHRDPRLRKRTGRAGLRRVVSVVLLGRNRPDQGFDRDLDGPLLHREIPLRTQGQGGEHSRQGPQADLPHHAYLLIPWFLTSEAV